MKVYDGASTPLLVDQTGTIAPRSATSLSNFMTVKFVRDSSLSPMCSDNNVMGRWSASFVILDTVETTATTIDSQFTTATAPEESATCNSSRKLKRLFYVFLTLCI